MAAPSIFIATHDAEDYRRLLHRALGPGTELVLASSPERLRDSYNGQTIVLGRPDFVAELLEMRPPLQWVQSTWAGVAPLIDHGFRNYRLTGLKGIFGPPMAEYVSGHILAHELRLERRVRSQRQRHWDDCHSGELRGKTVGIMGTGSIGSHIASVLSHFSVNLIGYNSRGTQSELFRRCYCRESLFEFLAACDYLIGILPRVPATTGLLDAQAFRQMKPSAVLINVGRGNLIDEEALCQALREDRIAAAILDVFETEPLPKDSPLWTIPNLKISAHTAAVSRPVDIAGLFLENYRRFREGSGLLNGIDFNRGY